MTRRTGLIIAVLALILAACGAGAPADDTFDPISGDAPVADATVTTAAPATTRTQPSASTGVSGELVVLQSAFERSAGVISGRMEGIIRVSGLTASAGITEMSIPFGGAFDNASGNFSFSMDLSGIAAAAGEEQIPPEFADLLGEMEVRQIGDTVYVKFAFFGLLLGVETPWISMPAEEGTDPTAGFTMTSPSNPSEILESYEDVAASIDVIGTETINGVETTHYRVIFDTEALLAQATPEERAEIEAQGPIPAEALPMDVWISEDGFVVRFVMEIDGSDVETTPEESFEQMLIRYDLFDLDSDVTIEPPPPGEVTDLDDLEPSFGFET